MRIYPVRGKRRGSPRPAVGPPLMPCKMLSGKKSGEAPAPAPGGVNVPAHPRSRDDHKNVVIRNPQRICWGALPGPSASTWRSYQATGSFLVTVLSPETKQLLTMSLGTETGWIPLKTYFGLAKNSSSLRLRPFVCWFEYLFVRLSFKKISPNWPTTLWNRHTAMGS